MNTVRGGLATSNNYEGGTMSHTIRNEKTKGFLDKLAQRRREHKEARERKAQELNYDFELELQFES